MLPFMGAEIVLVPAFLWIMGPAHWHTLIAVTSGTVYSTVLAIWARSLLLERAEDDANPAVTADWRWSRRQSPVSFEKQFRYFLMLGGWRTDTSAIGARDRAEFVTRKDRWTLALLFVGPGQESAGTNDLDRLVAMRTQAKATHAAIVVHARHDPVIASAAAVAQLQVLQYEDLAQLDRSLGLAL